MSSPRLHVVTGKGGVGKSTVACAIAIASAARGERTLAIEIPERAGLSHILGVVPAGPGVEAEVDDNLVAAHFDGEAALTEYLTRKVWLGPLRDVVLQHPLYRAFVRAAPGVQELMAIGKVRDELMRRSHWGHHWDTVVLDAGASGHSLQLLGMPAAAARAFGTGRVNSQSVQIDALLRDARQCAVHVVATPEDMPLKEAEQVITALRERLEMPLGRVFVNRCVPTPPAGAAQVVERLAAVADSSPAAETRRAIAGTGRAAMAWATIQERGVAALEQRCGLRVARLPRVDAAGDAREIALSLADAVAEALS